MVDPVWSWQPQAWVSPRMHDSQLIAPGPCQLLDPASSTSSSSSRRNLPLSGAQEDLLCPGSTMDKESGDGPQPSPLHTPLLLP